MSRRYKGKSRSRARVEEVVFNINLLKANKERHYSQEQVDITELQLKVEEMETRINYLESKGKNKKYAKKLLMVAIVVIFLIGFLGFNSVVKAEVKYDGRIPAETQLLLDSHIKVSENNEMLKEIYKRVIRLEEKLEKQQNKEKGNK